MIRRKRIYDPPAPEDGARFLVDRLWPRGVSREAAALSGWLRELAPSEELRRWFAHDPARWPEFRERYRRELGSAEAQKLLQDLARRARTGPVTLVYAARDAERNNARVLQELLEELLEDLPAGP
ncbi:MAG: DUF488 family protein [Syntrophobacterales bacterium]|nr:DUF488 family protein [Syntrophobacterales bacterium]